MSLTRIAGPRMSVRRSFFKMEELTCAQPDSWMEDLEIDASDWIATERAKWDKVDSKSESIIANKIAKAKARIKRETIKPKKRRKKVRILSTERKKKQSTKKTERKEQHTKKPEHKKKQPTKKTESKRQPRKTDRKKKLSTKETESKRQPRKTESKKRGRQKTIVITDGKCEHCHTDDLTSKSCMVCDKFLCSECAIGAMEGFFVCPRHAEKRVQHAEKKEKKRKRRKLNDPFIVLISTIKDSFIRVADALMAYHTASDRK